jgi:hypothetical protein
VIPQLLVFAILTAHVVLAAPPVAVKPHTRPVPPRAAAPKLSDADLQRAIQAKFAKSKISVNKFAVAVQGGVATITGRSDVIQHKATATRLAKAAGAVAVSNQIIISEAAKQKAAANLSRQHKRSEVKRALVLPR